MAISRDALRDRLERMAKSDDPDVLAQAKALLSILALYEHDPYMDVPANQLVAIMSRHLVKDEDVFNSRPDQLPHRNPRNGL